jgi:hypothetical protein
VSACIPGESGHVATLLFDSLTINMQPSSDGPAGIASLGVLVPFTVRKVSPQSRLTHHVRLFLDKPTDARVTLILDANGHRQIFDFPPGKAVHTAQLLRTVSFPITGLSNQEMLSVLLVATRSSVDSAVVVTVDSIDMLVRP